MKIRFFLKLSLVITIIGLLVFLGCKKNSSGTTVASGCDTANIQQLYFNGTLWSPVYSGAFQTSNYIQIGNTTDVTGDQFFLQLLKSAIVSGQTYNTSIIAGYSIIRSGVNYTITSGTITIKQLTSSCIKIIFSLQLNGGNQITNGYMIAGFS